MGRVGCGRGEWEGGAREEQRKTGGWDWYVRHYLEGVSRHSQVQFFKLKDDIVDIYFMGINGSSIGRHHVPLLFNHTQQEDQLASTCVPSLGGYGIAELEPFESQARGFQHGHRKVYKVPATREHDVVR